MQSGFSFTLEKFLGFCLGFILRDMASVRRDEVLPWKFGDGWMQSWRDVCLAEAGQEFIPQENSCRLSCASFSSLFPTWGCPRIDLWVCECSRPQKEDFCSQGSLWGNEPCAGCYPCTFQRVKHLWKPQTPKEPHGVTPGVSAGTG